MEDRFIYNANKLSLEYFDKLMKENVWKAFSIIHAGIQHQMRIILRYRFSKNNKGEPLGDHPEKWNIIYNKKFYGLVNDLFITGIITKDFKERILEFNHHRNKKLGHVNVYEQTEPSDNEIKEICLEGIEIAKELDKIIHGIFFPNKTSGWHQITFKTGGWDKSKIVIAKVIKPVVEKLEKTGDIVNFFFLHEPPTDSEPFRTDFTFYGNGYSVYREIQAIKEVSDITLSPLKNWNPENEKYRFSDDYTLGIKLFEIGSRLALCRIDGHDPKDTAGNKILPIEFIAVHVLIQNLGHYDKEGEFFKQYGGSLEEILNALREFDLR